LKIFAAILLVGLFLFNAVGYQLMFAFLILHQEEKMHSLLAESETESLTIIVIDSVHHSYFLQINEKEFFYKGNLYDIKSKEIKDDKIIYYCKKDEKELDLLNHFSKMNDENKSNNSKNPMSRLLQKTAQNLFFKNPELFQSLFPEKKRYCDTITARFDQPDSFQLTPPPQIYYS
jgi:hypothetical protein